MRRVTTVQTPLKGIPCPGLSRSRSPRRPRQPLRQRDFSTTDVRREIPRDVAVLGGGITGLASAYYLTREFPHAKVTVYESGARLGGWLHSKYVEVDNGKILFESGPRTLRPSGGGGFVTATLIQELGLKDEVLYTPKSSPAAQNRYLYYPDHLVKMPGPGQTFSELLLRFFMEPVFKGFLSGLAFEGFRDPRPSSWTDESIGSFVTRRFNRHIADNIVSAVLHGIYAGDLYQLSVRSINPWAWHAEGFAKSITLHAIDERLNEYNMMTAEAAQTMVDLKDYPLDKDIKGKMDRCSVFTFKRGLGQLAEALEGALRANPMVTIATSTRVSSLDSESDGSGNGSLRLRLGDAASPEPVHTHAISTLPANILHQLCPSAGLPVPETPAVTVNVVNLYYSSPNILPYQGFGYLIPRTIPLEQNPERALGVIFDSDAIPNGQDVLDHDARSAANRQSPMGVSGTKITVMMGGHWWDGYDPGDYPSAEDSLAMAQAVLRRHLGVQAQPSASNVTLQRDCIPQYTVGHSARLAALHRALRRAFEGRLRVAGSWFGGSAAGGGVGVNDCVAMARSVVRNLRHNETEGTGLELSGQDAMVNVTRKEETGTAAP